MKKLLCNIALVGLLLSGSVFIGAGSQNQAFASLGIASPAKSLEPPKAKSQETPAPSPKASSKASPGGVVIAPEDQFQSVSCKPAAKMNHVVVRKTTDNTRKNTQDISDAIAKQADFSYTYLDNAIYRIYCKEQRLTDIQLQPGETILFIGAGDTARWQVDTDVSGTGEAQQSHIYIKPLREEISTNLIINTNRHNYHCEIISSHRSYSPIISWIYPKEERAAILARKTSEQKGPDITGTFDCASMNFNYHVSGRKYPWKPQMVFSDQTHVYIQMPKTMKSDEAPALFIKDGKKVQLVNYRVRNSYYIVDRLFKEAELRCGNNTVLIKQTNSQTD